MEKRRIVICGATGQQGGGVARALLSDDKFEVVALSRNPGSAKAKQLESMGAIVVKADLDDESSLTRAFHGAYGVFGVTMPFTPDYKKCDGRKEVRQGKNIVNACLANNVQHLVFTSIFTANGRDELRIMDHLQSKFEIEDYIQEREVPNTILRPMAIMDMIGTMSFMPVGEKSTTGMVGKDVRMPFVHTDDIGAMCKIAFENPEKYIGGELAAVSDFFTGQELATIIGEVKGVANYKYKSAPRWVLWLVSKFGLMLDEFYQMHIMYTNWGTKPYPPSILEALKEADRLNPNRVTIDKYIRKHLGAEDVTEKKTADVKEESLV